MEAKLAADLEQCVSDKALQRRLLFHWHTAHAMLLRLPAAPSPDDVPGEEAPPAACTNEDPTPKTELSPSRLSAMTLSHAHATAFIRLVRAMQASKDKPMSRPLPHTVLEHFCDACFGLLLPGRSATVRVVHQKHNSSVNKKLARQHSASKRKAKLLHKAVAPCVRVRNAVVTTCMRCQHHRMTPGAPVKKRRSVPKANQVESAPPPPPVKRPASSLFGPPPSPPTPPRKLLDGPAKKKKKVKPATKPPSALDSFLKSLQ
ncbi:Aste57867_16923 [Aphanomyces stellatus]|uniref:Aste57867_16923 protein n=1 Tax=Aphanomyces stellatus TaxID=120398 RepID=A0A485L9Q9_9STRA|nr:hypothetical protein As57867_016865 [Aphanomyces stellatus]VFT93685.1 Aste57867_16923 [Aphanomyces stellatus]